MKKKENKIFRLLLKIQQSQQQPSVNLNNWQKQVSEQEVPLISSIRMGKDQITNIFQKELCQKQQLPQESLSFQILCKKQIDAFKLRAKKTKRNEFPTISKLKITDSFYSNSKQSFSDSAFFDNYLTKKQLQQYFEAIQSDHSGSLKKKNYHKSNSERNKHTSLEKIKIKHKKYQNQWNLNRSKTQKPQQVKDNCSIALINGIKHSPNLVNLHTERKKREKLEELALMRLKENISPITWNSNLRNPMSLKHNFDMKYIQKIDREGLNLKGLNKLNKEYSWVQSINNSLFLSLEKKEKFTKSKLNEGQRSVLEYQHSVNVTSNK